MPAFLGDFKRMQQACGPLLGSLSTFACHAVEGVTINVMVQGRPVIVQLNLASCSVSSLVTTRWLIMGELEELSNHTLRDPETMIFIKN